MKIKKLLCILLALIVAFSACACGATVKTEPAAEAQVAAPAETADAAPAEYAAPENIAMEILGSTGTSFQVSVGIAEILNNGYDSWQVSATSTANAAANVATMPEKDPTQCIYMVGNTQFISAKEGTGSFSEAGPTDQQRLICAFTFGNNCIVTLNPDIKEIKDLDGKKVGWLNQAIHYDHFVAACDILGIKPDVQFIGMGDLCDSLADGIVDACFMMLSGADNTVMTPVTALQELCLTKKVYAVSFPKELQDQAAEKLSATWPYFPTTALEGSLPDAGAFELYGNSSVELACYAGCDEDVVYAITKALCENCAELAYFDASCNGLTPEMMVSLMGDVSEEDIHPGALKYYKEVGLWPAA